MHGGQCEGEREPADKVPLCCRGPSAKLFDPVSRETELNAVEHGDADAEVMPYPTFFLRTVGHGGPEPIKSHQRKIGRAHV